MAVSTRRPLICRGCVRPVFTLTIFIWVGSVIGSVKSASVATPTRVAASASLATPVPERPWGSLQSISCPPILKG